MITAETCLSVTIDGWDAYFGSGSQAVITRADLKRLHPRANQPLYGRFQNPTQISTGPFPLSGEKLTY